jgi:WS/DGAT/MGAT family acyltransferase
MGASELMSGADAAWFRLEESTNPTIVNAVLWFGEPPDWERLTEVLRERLVERFPRFRQRVVRKGVLARPSWEEDPHFELSAHVQRAALPAPGGQAALQELVSREMNQPLEPARPLWKILLVQGDGSGGAMLVRVHHCIADGITLARVLLSLTDEQARADADSGQLWEGGGEPPLPLRHLLQRARGAVGTARAAWRRGKELLAEPIHLVDLTREGARSAAALRQMLELPPEPPSPFRGPLGTQRRAAWSRPFPLERVKEVGRAAGGTVNDVLLTAVAGALRRYVWARGHAVEDLRAAVPVNLRPLSEPLPRELGNHFGVVFLALPLSLEAPLERMRELKRRMDALKRSPQALVTMGVLEVAGWAPMAVERAVADLLETKATLVMTNVPGPRRPVHLAGMRLGGVMFWALPAGLGLCVSVFSYAGQVALGVTADAGLVPDPQALIEGFHEELDALWQAALTLPESGEPAGR